MTNENKELEAFPEGFNLVGKVVILKPSFSKSGIPYVFKISGGSGARDGMIGTGIFGTFLIDGEEAKVRDGNILRLATTKEIEDKSVSLETLGGMYKKSELESEIGHLSFQILKISHEVGVYLKDVLNKIEMIEALSKSDAEQIKALQKYYIKLDPFSN